MQKMTPDEIKTFLATGTRTGKLATVRADGQPHVAPIWFVLDGNDLLFNTWRTSVKAKNMLRDNRVSICVDEETPPFAFVIVEGTAVPSTIPPKIYSGPPKSAAVTWAQSRPQPSANETASPANTSSASPPPKSSPKKTWLAGRSRIIHHSSLTIHHF